MKEIIMRSLVIVFFATSCIFMFSPMKSIADQPDANLVRLLTLGLKDQRDRLIRGIFRAHGRYIDDNPETGHLEGAVDIFCAFDFQKKLFRFDRVEPCRVSTQKPGDPPPKDKNAWVKRETGGKFVRTPEHTLHVIHGAVNPAIAIKKNTEPPYSQIKPFDVRALGLLSFTYMDDTSLSEVYKSWASFPPNRIVKENKHVYRMIIYNEGYEYNYWIDEQQGYSPIRYEVRENVTSKDHKWRTAATCEMSSEQINGVWVPRSFAAEQHFPTPDDARLELAINWESVNKPVPDKLFTPDGLQIPRGTLVINQKSEKPFIERSIGGGPVRAVMADEVKQPPPAPTKRVKTNSAWRLALVVLFVLVLLVVAWFRFRAKRAATRGST